MSYSTLPSMPWVAMVMSITYSDAALFSVVLLAYRRMDAMAFKGILPLPSVLVASKICHLLLSIRILPLLHFIQPLHGFSSIWLSDPSHHSTYYFTEGDAVY